MGEHRITNGELYWRDEQALPWHEGTVHINWREYRLHKCEVCGTPFVCIWRAWQCPTCRAAHAEMVKERTRKSNAERAAQRKAARANINCTACGKPVGERQRGSGERPVYCSNKCRQWTYRRRKSAGKQVAGQIRRARTADGT